MALSIAVQGMLTSASRSGVERSFSRLPNYWRNGRWLGLANRYKSGCIDQIKADMQASQLVPPQLAEYIAASSLLHAMDGWSLLGKALHSHIAGDCDTARHLAYYAELRGAMSLLASEGVGVFDKKHFVIDAPRRAAYVGKAESTHVFAWESLDFWAQSPNAASLIFSIFAPDGKPLGDWLQAFSSTPASDGLLVRDWIGGWGLDLARLQSDRGARNLSSYRPTEFHNAGPVSIDKTLDGIWDFWGLAEPSPSGGFQKLDIYLLRQALQRKFRSLHPNGRTSNQARRSFRQQVDSMLHTISPSVKYPFDWSRFLMGEDLPENPALLVQASGRLKPNQLGHDVQVIARAAILLRVASGAGKRLLGTLTEEDRATLSFWLEPLADHLGLCNPGQFPAQTSDFWADVEAALVNSRDWQQVTDEPDRSRYRFNTDCAPAAATLSSAEMAGIWALGL